MSAKKIELEMEPVIKNNKKQGKEIPDYTDPEWTEYVISMLHEEEMWQGIPKLDGLRRLVEKLISPIKEMSVSLQPIIHNNPIIIAIATVKLEDGQIFSAASDATPYSAPEGFRNRLSALADSRAKSKVFREILRLRNVSTNEEIQSGLDQEEHELIVSTQKLLINNLLLDIQKTFKKKIDLQKLIEEIFPKKGLTIDSLKHSQAGTVIQKLSDFKGKRSDIQDIILEK